ncbi:DUF1501 domain-containing protein [Amphritea balenae]|uniref:DUF1501 domain-containing protein n=1 Tax=Amphritea balenae TaxID=452629 RepID=A0A3P1SUE6_9GAMM|nr:DUF1501 domain-containing protein [Amphritea balenae]RRD00176.1 DUF1501 domain-containing protein [Amphritea balenae]GGK77274.1 hypothetical protein GCM10007941_29290 [Amphritea balenae]
MNRRQLLRMVALSPFLFNARVYSIDHKELPVLILIELNGGNDTLNSYIPLNQLESYYRLRPKLGVGRDKMIDLDTDFALHPSLEPLKQSWLDGDFALIHGLGYEKPNKSHFRSIDIWDTANKVDNGSMKGWLSNVIDGMGRSGLDSIVFGRNPGCVTGGMNRFIQFKNMAKFVKSSKSVMSTNVTTSNDALNSVISSQNYIHEGKKLLKSFSRDKKLLGSLFPRTTFGMNLSDICTLVQLNSGIPVYKLALSGFDTHSKQTAKHSQLLKQLASGLNSLKNQLKISGHWENTLIMTYSEFGRRAFQNGSGGTDHGTAATHLVMGGRVVGGHYGADPDIKYLVNNDMLYTTDFRHMYQTVISDWWKKDYKIATDTETLKFLKTI